MNSMDSENLKSSASETPEATRDFSTPIKRLLIIGLDGATFDVLTPLMDQGRMPHLKIAVDDGVSGILRSTTPPITPAAWTTFLTGLQPGSHGIIDFERYDVHTNKLQLNSTRCLDHVRNIWQLLGDRGFKVGSVNVPMTYPPIEINGFMVSGFETPGPQSEFVYPAELKQEILQRWPDPTLKAKWKRKWFGGRKLFKKNVDYVARSFHQGADMSIMLGDRFGWDVMMVVFKLIDNLQHKTWKYLDPRWSHRDPYRQEITIQGIEEMDKAVGTLMDYAQQHDATVLMVSDHGHGSLEGKVQPNLLLKQWGYLKLRGGGAQRTTRSRYILDRFFGRTKKFARTGDIEHDLAVDFSNTRACIMHAGMAGFLYINLAGRQPTGTVKPEDYESLRDELKAKFLSEDCSVINPEGKRIALFTEVHKPEELYNCSREDQPWLPDLILVPYESLAVVRKIRGTHAVRWQSYRRMEGTHRPDGIIIAHGPGITQKKNIHAHIVDCAPTIMAMMGLRIPEDMEGHVITDLFETPPTVEKIAAEVHRSKTSKEEVYSEQDLEQITARLSDLGYLE